MKKFLRFVLLLSLLVLFPLISPAADLGPTYSESVQLAIDHAANPAGWLAPSLFVLGPGAPASQGLTHDATGALIVRTATGSWNFRGNFVGEANYKIYDKNDPTHTATWVTTGNDATKFLIGNRATGATVTKLIERGLGMPDAGTHHAIIEFTVAPTNDNLLRPTRNPDNTQYLPAAYGTGAPFVQPAGMSDAKYAAFTAYYNNWMGDAYSSNPKKMFPFTQLGYTLFWNNGYLLPNITGMSEFIMLGGTDIGIYGIYAAQSYLYTRNDGSSFSTADSAQFGNGFASFKIDGTSDTVWAGHRFQAKASSDTADGKRNQIIIENNGSVSGGQGLLVWSLNYDVLNSGSISGATIDKFNIPGTANTAVLFKGDISASFGTPVLNGVNRVVNAGTIQSPGTAIKAEAGNTLITNNAGGAISGGDYAIQTGAGDDAVTVNGGKITGNIDLGAGADIFVVTAGGNAALAFSLNRDTSTAARVANVETVAIADNTTIAVNVAGTNNIRNNDRFLIVDAPALTVNPANLTVQGDSAFPMLAFSAEKTGNQLSLLATRDTSYYGQKSGNASLGAALDGLAQTATGDMAAVLSALDSSGAAGNARQLEPKVDGGAIQAGYETIGQFNHTVMGRIGQVLAARPGGMGVRRSAEAPRENPGYLRYAASDQVLTDLPGEIRPAPGSEAAGLWAQGFGTYLDQRPRGASNGYDAHVWGVSVGYDRFIFPHLMAGFGGGYAHNKIATNDVSTRTDVDSYQGNVYGSFAKDAYYLDGILSFAYNRYDATRHIVLGGLDRIAKSSYGGRQYSAYFEGGRTFTKNGLALTPLVSLQYMRLHLNDYTETEAGALNLAVESQNYHLFQTGLGVNVAYPTGGSDRRITPEVHALWRYDFVGDRQQATSQFTGGGASFSTSGFDPAQSSYNIGAKLTLAAKSNVTVSLGYDFEWKEDFSGHSGMLNVRYAF